LIVSFRGSSFFAKVHFPTRAASVLLFHPSHETGVVGFIHAKHSTAVDGSPYYPHPTNSVDGRVVLNAFILLNLAGEL
jgi:hypothetical protein